MKVGVLFPTYEIDPHPQEIRSFVQEIESMGFNHVMIYDHVVGVDAATNPSWEGKFDLSDRFHEPLTLLAYLAGVCSLELVTGVLVLTQRQTALVAKQVAQIDLLSQGRVRLGVGIGWNEFEFRALGVPFERRGARIEEQVQMLRRLWAEDVVRCETEFHRFDGIGLNPRPQDSIPVWMGALSDAGLRRAGRISDGVVWIRDPDDTTSSRLDLIRRGAEQAGRDPASVGLDVHISAAPGQDDAVPKVFEAWQQVGATHATIKTSKLGHSSIASHLDAFGRASEALGLRSGH